MMIFLCIAGYIFAGSIIGKLLYNSAKPEGGEEVAVIYGISGGILWPITIIMFLGFCVSSKLIREKRQ